MRSDKGGLEAREYALERHPGKIVVFVGEEYTCCRVHMNFINITETMPVCQSGLCNDPTNEQVRLAIDRVHALGGIAIANHLFWSMKQQGERDQATLPQYLTAQELLDLGVDGFEAVNTNTLDWMTLQFALANNKIVVTGSDMHEPYGVYGYTILDASLTEASILTALRARTNSILYNAVGNFQTAFPPSDSAFDAILPLFYLGFFFSTFIDVDSGQYSFQSGSCHSPIVHVHGVAILMYFVYGFVFILFFFLLWRLVLLVCAVIRSRLPKRNARNARNPRNDDDEEAQESM